jgi:hypothetical protein
MSLGRLEDLKILAALRRARKSWAELGSFEKFGQRDLFTGSERR